ncbi:S-adenosyl-L-methionine-dependent methyltransferase [Mycena sanguinolenta]|uniref:S-adenosyl-L-methionine-dependent methyltransferase n=1 Tax=Mycena sanguinolenta TaxID=230812 RepID=A0A8H6XMB4_9AGAR|nr:S-adenosyl-L-methionine-dependent methyltransferase [Mycena sanguinolenta]
MEIRDSTSPPPVVLDVGSGSGSWAIEMGSSYPQAQILGVDLVIDRDLHAPSNVQFKQLDITKGLPSVDRGYAIIHARVVTGHLKDPSVFVQAAYAALAPGGLLILCDACKPLWGDNSAPIPLIPGIHVPNDAPTAGSWWVGWMDVWFRTAYKHYRPVDELIKEHHELSLVHQERYLVPTHEFNDDEARPGLGAISNSILLGFCRGVVDTLLATGQFTRSQIDEWITLIEKEFETKPIYMTWDVACGVKSS